MQLFRSSVILMILGTLAVVSASAKDPLKKFKPSFGSADAESTSPTITVSYGQIPPNSNDFKTAVENASAWKISVDQGRSRIKVKSALLQREGTIVLTLSTPVPTKDLTAPHQMEVSFAGSGEKSISADSVRVTRAKAAGSQKSWFLPEFNLSGNKKDANLDVSGSLQSGVGAKPQYQWSVLAKYPALYEGANFLFRIGPQFTGTASQEPNADPDSLSASLATEAYFPRVHLVGKNSAFNIISTPVDYEFERKAKQEAVLNNGNATLHSYQQKNSNLMFTAKGQLVDYQWPVNINLSLGTELGASISRSALNLTSKPGTSIAPLRAVVGADVYFDLPDVGKSPLLSVDAHYTLRSLFHSEPFKQAGVNSGNEFYTTKARHYIAVNLARTLATGVNLTAQYRFGSLPPTFTFLDHQVTVGFEVVFGK